jgi:hypothetical protein
MNIRPTPYKIGHTVFYDLTRRVMLGTGNVLWPPPARRQRSTKHLVRASPRHPELNARFFSIAPVFLEEEHNYYRASLAQRRIATQQIAWLCGVSPLNPFI